MENLIRWEWRFAGGEPAASDEQNPGGITYIKRWTSLMWNLSPAMAIYSDTLLREKMITVKTPDQSRIRVTKDVPEPLEIFLGSSDVKRLEVFVYNKLGRLMTNYEFSNVTDKVELDLYQLAADLIPGADNSLMVYQVTT
ncbi:MAG: hypothetical protein U5Q03_06730 [Bacteroidota bacterium]|nr:hypothetical protein [Bacteroidota bacterium]